mgnify:CR=1 FL=1
MPNAKLEKVGQEPRLLELSRYKSVVSNTRIQQMFSHSFVVMI